MNPTPLARVLDHLVPPSPDGRLPGAGEAIADDIARLLEETPDLRAATVPGLEALESAAAERGATDFAALDPEVADELIARVASEQPAFLGGLTFHVYVRYYQCPQVVEALGLEARPPHPLGYAMSQSDLDALLAPVLDRGPIFRR